mmetsp:Transcript_11965/g.28000  ORF Transcript_11965/g.28000 Transcript_11965/m.28000 type:complete len:495 (+) Transcript_11965:1461-2945(+)
MGFSKDSSLPSLSSVASLPALVAAFSSSPLFSFSLGFCSCSSGFSSAVDAFLFFRLLRPLVPVLPFGAAPSASAAVASNPSTITLADSPKPVSASAKASSAPVLPTTAACSFSLSSFGSSEAGFRPLTFGLAERFFCKTSAGSSSSAAFLSGSVSSGAAAGRRLGMTSSSCSDPADCFCGSSFSDSFSGSGASFFSCGSSSSTACISSSPLGGTDGLLLALARTPGKGFRVKAGSESSSASESFCGDAAASAGFSAGASSFSQLPPSSSTVFSSSCDASDAAASLAVPSWSASGPALSSPLASSVANFRLVSSIALKLASSLSSDSSASSPSALDPGDFLAFLESPSLSPWCRRCFLRWECLSSSFRSLRSLLLCRFRPRSPPWRSRLRSPPLDRRRSRPLDLLWPSLRSHLDFPCLVRCKGASDAPPASSLPSEAARAAAAALALEPWLLASLSEAPDSAAWGSAEAWASSLSGAFTASPSMLPSVLPLASSL